MMTIGIDLASGPDRGGMAVRTPDGWQFIEYSHGELVAAVRLPGHQAAVEAALQERVRAHADRQGPCVTVEEATDPAAGMRAYLLAARRWQVLGFDECSSFVTGPLPSERLAKRMGLGQVGHPVCGALGTHIRADRGGWSLEASPQ